MKMNEAGLILSRGKDVRKVNILMMKEEAEKLAELAGKVKDGTIVEIGTYQGGSAIIMGVRMKGDSKLITIDTHKDIEAQHEKNSLKKASDNIHFAGLGDKIILVINDSKKYAKVRDIPIDLLYIDGSHKYEDVKADYELWSPFVKKGGTIVFHDFDDGHPGVKKYLIEEVLDEVDYKICNVLIYWEV